MLCSLIFIHELWDLQLNVDSERQIFLRNFFMTILFILKAFAKNLLRGIRGKNISIFSFNI